MPCQYILAPSPPARNPTSYAHALPGEQSTCGPEARLTGSLHDGGLRSVHSPSQQQLHAPNTVSDMHILPDGWSINTANDSHVQMICQKDILQSDTIWDTINFLQRALRNQLELFGSRRKASLFGTGTALYDGVKRSVPDSGNVITVAQLLRTALVGHGHAAQFRWRAITPSDACSWSYHTRNSSLLGCAGLEQQTNTHAARFAVPSIRRHIISAPWTPVFVSPSLLSCADGIRNDPVSMALPTISQTGHKTSRLPFRSTSRMTVMTVRKSVTTVVMMTSTSPLIATPRSSYPTTNPLTACSTAPRPTRSESSLSI